MDMERFEVKCSSWCHAYLAQSDLTSSSTLMMIELINKPCRQAAMCSLASSHTHSLTHKPCSGWASCHASDGVIDTMHAQASNQASKPVRCKPAHQLHANKQACYWHYWCMLEQEWSQQSSDIYTYIYRCLLVGSLKCLSEVIHQICSVCK
jgi:hypothetical protein